MNFKEQQTHPEFEAQKKEAFNLLISLLAERNAKDYREAIGDLFSCFLRTEDADYKPTRETMMYLHSSLVEFFTKLHHLPTIDRFRN